MEWSTTLITPGEQKKATEIDFSPVRLRDTARLLRWVSAFQHRSMVIYDRPGDNNLERVYTLD